MYAIGVDKSGLLVGGREEIRRIQAAQNRRKKLLRPFPVSARVGLSHHRSYRASVSGRPASAGFLF
jgi:putative NIF3 family GTP cyclohydrolase 1 type 2